MGDMEFVKQEIHGFVLLITIDRQAKLNALNTQVLNELLEALNAVDYSKTRCVVITGGGNRAFGAGADVGEMFKMSASEAVAFGRLAHKSLRAIENLEIPVIAAVNGFAFGGGCELALACDIRLASETASFSQPEVALGITAGFGGTQRLPRLIGESVAKHLLLTGDRIYARRALEIGLVDKVIAPDALIPEALKMATAIAGKAPLAVRATKRAIDEGRALELSSALEVELKHFAVCFDSSDKREAMSAFLEKRKALPFKGE
jgi:enoyl-CoA hydratase